MFAGTNIREIYEVTLFLVSTPKFKTFHNIVFCICRYAEPALVMKKALSIYNMLVVIPQTGEVLKFPFVNVQMCILGGVTWCFVHCVRASVGAFQIQHSFICFRLC